MVFPQLMSKYSPQSVFFLRDSPSFTANY